MGWGGHDDARCSCTHVTCYATDGVHAVDDDVPWACTHVTPYATDGVGLDDDARCSCTHVTCYATDGVRWMMTFLGLAHM